MESGSRGTRLIAFLEHDVPARFEDRLLPVDLATAETWGRLEARAGRPLSTVDTLLAAAALTHRMTLVTRNTDDFRFQDLLLLNPWELPRS